MDLDKLKSLLDNQNIAIDIQGDYVRFNLNIGNDDTWQEIEIDGRTIEEIAAVINIAISKIKTGEINQVPSQE